MSAILLAACLGLGHRQKNNQSCRFAIDDLFTGIENAGLGAVILDVSGSFLIAENELPFAIVKTQGRARIVCNGGGMAAHVPRL